MAQPNQISFKLSENDSKDIIAAIEILKTKLMPQLISIKADEKRELAKMGAKTVDFVTKAVEVCKQYPQFIPQFVDFEELKIDFDAVQSLRSMFIPLEAITNAIDDTMVLSGSEVYNAALMVYQSLKIATKANIPNAKNAYDELSKRFPGRPPSKTAEIKDQK